LGSGLAPLHHSQRAARPFKVFTRPDSSQPAGQRRAREGTRRRDSRPFRSYLIRHCRWGQPSEPPVAGWRCRCHLINRGWGSVSSRQSPATLDDLTEVPFPTTTLCGATTMGSQHNMSRGRACSLHRSRSRQYRSGGCRQPGSRRERLRLFAPWASRRPRPVGGAADGPESQALMPLNLSQWRVCLAPRGTGLRNTDYSINGPCQYHGPPSWPLWDATNGAASAGCEGGTAGQMRKRRAQT